MSDEEQFSQNIVFDNFISLMVTLRQEWRITEPVATLLIESAKEAQGRMIYECNLMGMPNEMDKLAEGNASKRKENIAGFYDRVRSTTLAIVQTSKAPTEVKRRAEARLSAWQPKRKPEGR